MVRCRDWRTSFFNLFFRTVLCNTEYLSTPRAGCCMSRISLQQTPGGLRAEEVWRVNLMLQWIWKIRHCNEYKKTGGGVVVVLVVVLMVVVCDGVRKMTKIGSMVKTRSSNTTIEKPRHAGDNVPVIMHATFGMSFGDTKRSTTANGRTPDWRNSSASNHLTHCVTWHPLRTWAARIAQRHLNDFVAGNLPTTPQVYYVNYRTADLNVNPG